MSRGVSGLEAGRSSALIACPGRSRDRPEAICFLPAACANRREVPTRTNGEPRTGPSVERSVRVRRHDLKAHTQTACPNMAQVHPLPE